MKKIVSRACLGNLILFLSLGALLLIYFVFILISYEMSYKFWIILISGWLIYMSIVLGIMLHFRKQLTTAIVDENGIYSMFVRREHKRLLWNDINYILVCATPKLTIYDLDWNSILFIVSDRQIFVPNDIVRNYDYKHQILIRVPQTQYSLWLDYLKNVNFHSLDGVEYRLLQEVLVSKSMQFSYKNNEWRRIV